MKHITKISEPLELLDFKSKANADWQPSFDGMSGDLKKTLHDALLNEQGWICCYCNRRIGHASSHLEHLRPRSKFPQHDLSYDNLLASCQREDRRGEPLHCGKLKADWYDEFLLVSPLRPDCENRFRFTADGGIHPAQEADNAASETGHRLGLDIPKLRRLREAAIDAVVSDLPILTAEDLARFSIVLLQRDSAGILPEFCIAVVCILRGLLAP